METSPIFQSHTSSPLGGNWHEFLCLETFPRWSVWSKALLIFATNSSSVRVVTEWQAIICIPKPKTFPSMNPWYNVLWIDVQGKSKSTGLTPGCMGGGSLCIYSGLLWMLPGQKNMICWVKKTVEVGPAEQTGWVELHRLFERLMRLLDCLLKDLFYHWQGAFREYLNDLFMWSK